MSNHITNTLGKWQMLYMHGRSVQYYDPFVRQFAFGIFKLTSMPEQGVSLSNANYKGFIISFIYRVPIAKN